MDGLVKRPLRPRLLGDRLSICLDLEVIVLEIGRRRDDRPDGPERFVGRVFARVHGHGLGAIEAPQLGDGAVQEDVLAEDGRLEQVEGYRDPSRRWARLLGDGRRIGALCRGRGAGCGDGVGRWLTPWKGVPSAAVGRSQKGGIRPGKIKCGKLVAVVPRELLAERAIFERIFLHNLKETVRVRFDRQDELLIFSGAEIIATGWKVRLELVEEGETCIRHVNRADLVPLINGVVELFSSRERAQIPRNMSFGH